MISYIVKNYVPFSSHDFPDLQNTFMFSRKTLELQIKEKNRKEIKRIFFYNKYGKRKKRE